MGLRAHEGLEENKGWYVLPGEKAPESVITEIRENGIRYKVDVENGQKTGFFLDQKYNRREVARLARGHRVLDCFTHTGSFALNAVAGGAEHATAVDVSASAIEMAKENAALNGMTDRMDFIVADVFDLLPRLEEEGSPYDFIILDPPAFTKSRKTVSNALRGYKEINKRAMHLLPRGGYLATCSCSHFADEEHFKAMLAEAAAEAGVSLRQIEGRKQAPDHPILWGVPETDYLKFCLFQVVLEKFKRTNEENCHHETTYWHQLFHQMHRKIGKLYASAAAVPLPWRSLYQRSGARGRHSRYSAFL